MSNISIIYTPTKPTTLKIKVKNRIQPTPNSVPYTAQNWGKLIAILEKQQTIITD